MDAMSNKILEFLCVNSYNLEWVGLVRVAKHLGVDSDLSQIAPWKLHIHPELEKVVHLIRADDGKTYDLRSNFVGMEDAVRLRRDITTSIASIPALAWKERIYEFMVDYIQKETSTFSEESGMNISEIVKIPEMARPPSLKLARVTAKGGKKVRHVSDAELLRQILAQDRRFDLKFHVQQNLHSQRASDRAARHNKQRLTVLERHHRPNDYIRSDFDNEYAIFLTSDPVYTLRYAAISGRVGDTLLKSTGGEFGKVDDPSICGCGAIIYKKNIHRFTRDGLAKCEEQEIWRYRHTVGNHALRQVGEYRALLAGLKMCSDKGYFPLRVQGWSDQVNSHATAMIYKEPDLTQLDYSQMKRYKRPEPAFESHLCIPLYNEAKRLCNLIIETSRDEHYQTPKDYNILGLPGERWTDERVWQVSGSPSAFKKCGNGIERPPCEVIPLASLHKASVGTVGGTVTAGVPLEDQAESPHSADSGVIIGSETYGRRDAWTGVVPGCSLALSMTEPLLPPIVFERIHVQDSRYHDVLAEADKARTEGFIKDRGWSSKTYVARDEDWTKNLKYGT